MFMIMQHPLCSGEVSAVRLRLHLSADTLEAVHEECEDYSDIIRELMDTRERERKDKVWPNSFKLLAVFLSVAAVGGSEGKGKEGAAAEEGGSHQRRSEDQE